MTYRQFLAWGAWLDAQWNAPDRTDHYLMQIAAEVRYVMSDKERPVDKFRLPFKTREGPPPSPSSGGSDGPASGVLGGMTREQVVNVSKMAWVARLEAAGNSLGVKGLAEEPLGISRRKEDGR